MYNLFKFIAFKVVTFTTNKPLPMFRPTLEHFLECCFQNGELLCRMFLDLVKCVETASFQGILQLSKQKKSAGAKSGLLLITPCTHLSMALQ
jgi:hypothetical protein